ncbi:hypothetical protein PENANT_c023G06692 [Penicillium antarcticum]|uniref:Adenosine deaminase domain-containing protein n=1 Tax=Penicillium antarcticum TaxID=416450 RepID=A0A1V6PYF8_9EURO|nr:hypothetical protein PENANT_c023G06692 [Penicillium antarcticum]
MLGVTHAPIFGDFDCRGIYTSLLTAMTAMDTSKPVDVSFVKALPKIELHAHLSGSISRQCLHELWQQKKAENPDFDVEDPLVLMPPGKVDYDLKTFFSTFSKLTYQICNDLKGLVYATNSVLQDFLDDGVVYLELRTIPRASPGITRDEYINTVLTTIEKFKTKCNRMTVSLILAIDRGSMNAAQADEIVDMAIANKPRGVVGVDICGNPTKGDVSIYRDAFARAKSSGLGITVHFAETVASASPVELATLLEFMPDRLGHVIHVPDEFKREISRRKLGLELCISCNVHAKMISGGPVSNEYLLAALHFDLSREDLLRICYKATEAIFAGEAEKERIAWMLDVFKVDINMS